MNTSQFNAFVRGVSARVNEIIDETKDLTPSFQNLPIYKHVSTDAQIHRTRGVVGFSEVELVNEGDSLKYDRTYQSYETAYAIRQHMKGVTVSQLLNHTRQSDLEEALDEVRQLRYAITRKMNRHFWQNFNDGFSATDGNANRPISRLGDGVSWFSTAHPSVVPGVANRSNVVTGTGSGAYSGVNPVLNETSLFEAEIQLQEQSNGRGLPIGYEGKAILVVPPALKKLAFEITRSDLRSDTANNDINYFSGGKMDFISSTYLGAAHGGSDTRWFVLAAPGAGADNATSLRWVSLIEPKIEMEPDFNTKAIKISVDAAWATGYSNFEYAVGSTGLQA